MNKEITYIKMNQLNLKLKNFISVLFVALFFSNAYATEYTISSDSELSNLSLVAGDVVTWTNGTYSNQSIVVHGSGTVNNPIILKAETEGGVTFTGESPANIYGTYVQVEGFYWEGGQGTSDHVSFRRSGSDTDFGVNCALRNCGFNNLASEGDNKSRWVVLYGTQNTIENCSFVNKLSTGATILVELRFQGASLCQHQIKNNYFYNITNKDGRTNSGDSEAIRIGVSTNQAVDANCTVEGNYFQEADGENEIITNKSANNIYKYNTFRNCRGSLVMRHGAGAWVEGNFFLGEGKDGSGGIRISDSFHTIINNYFQGLRNKSDKWNNAITIVEGETSSGGASNGYQYVDDILVAFNTSYDCDDPLYFNDRGSRPATGIIANNLFHTATGAVVDLDNTGLDDDITFINNLGDGSSLGIDNSGLTAASVSFVANGEVFKPNANSAVVDAATGSYPGVSSDLVGSTRPTSNKDIGAHEVAGAVSLGTRIPITDAEVGTSVGCCFLSASGTSLSGCNIVVGPSLSVNPNSLTLDYLASSKSISISSNVAWAISDDADWINLSASSGSNNGDIVIQVSENPGSSPRSGTVTVSEVGGSLVATIFVDQGIFTPQIEVNTETVSFSVSSGNQDIQLSSNVDWTITDDADWIIVNPITGSQNGVVTISVSENTSGGERSGTITINDDHSSLSKTVSVMQTNSTFNPEDAEAITIIDVIGIGTQVGSPDVTEDNVNDDLTDTRWSGESNDGSAYLDLDLECPRILTAVQIYFHKGGDRTSDFSIELSEDGVNFSEVISETTSSQIIGFQEFALQSTPTARFVRVRGYGNSVNNWNSYEEIDIYGDNSPIDCVVTDVSSSEQKATISFYPNPSSGKVILSESTSYSVFNSVGVEVISGDGNRIDLSSSPKGMYTLLLDGIAQRVLIQ